MVPREISELHDETDETAEYSVDLSEEPATVPSESTPISGTEESDWGFQEPEERDYRRERARAGAGGIRARWAVKDRSQK